VDIDIVPAAHLWHAQIDGTQLENAILNLCINARDAMPEGGRLTIRTANIELEEAAAREWDLPPGGYVSLCVTDTGTGMSEQ
ncbi:hybrid sensor histidine kinase/response regulator, partial [Klebsiella aerogenes]|nr:hybrid sensor histidine kinase/response regulator [Klebsiella aerogenes]